MCATEDTTLVWERLLTDYIADFFPTNKSNFLKKKGKVSVGKG